MPPLKVAIMGGTFDPIHCGHLTAAEQIREKYSIDLVLFIPAGIPPHKSVQPEAIAEDRYAMTILATASNPKFEVSRVEIEREGASYAIDTINYLKELYGEDSALYFITGADAFLEIGTWHRVEDVLKSCTFVAVSRPGSDFNLIRDRIKPEWLKNVEFCTITGVDISATEIRLMIKENKSIRYLVPQNVEEYIYKRNLYNST